MLDEEGHNDSTPAMGRMRFSTTLVSISTCGMPAAAVAGVVEQHGLQAPAGAGR